MGAVQQRTLNCSVEFAGVGLHSGADCRIIVKPASEHAGIVFRSQDFDGDNLIAASPQNVILTNHGTTLGNGAGASVSTVEHLMAAFAICAVDNALVEVIGPEIPILDGSATEFVNGFNGVGFADQSARRRAIPIEQPLEIHDGDRFIEISPYEGFSLEVVIDFEDCLIGRQELTLHLGDPSQQARLAKSRTFCRLHEVEALRRVGLIRGGSLHNSIVVDGDRLLNEEALRDPEEFVLHKALDLIGDLYLLGAPVRGAIRAVKPGHDLNARLALEIARRYGLSEPDAGQEAALLATA